MRKYFCGQYYKCQSDTQTLAVIPARHGDTQSVQLICDDGAWNYSGEPDKNSFFRDGIELNMQSDGFSAVGRLYFGELLPIKYDIMGPFKYVPFMQCRHSVISMKHSVNGEIRINGKDYIFRNGEGYIEGDRGYSFPKEYAWTQSFFDGGSLMLSAADIPFAGFHFTGVIGVIVLHGSEYRLATYLGARAVKTAEGEVVIRQGDYSFSARLIEKKPLPLLAPVCGSMVRTIRESAACKAAYCFKKGGETLLQFETDKASFEFEYGEKA